MPYLRGRVEHVLHNSGTYYVLAFKVEETDTLGRTASTKLSGHLFGISNLSRGVTLQVDGEWKQHPRYGRQFSAHGWTPWAKSTFDIESFLVDCVQGVFADKELIKKIVGSFGLGTYEALLQPGLLDLAADDRERVLLREAGTTWSQVRGIATLADFLRGYNLGPGIISAVFQRFGFDAIEIISSNPYSLIEIEGFQFHKADTFAVRMGILSGDPRRIAGAVLWVIRDQIRQQGHLYLRQGDLLGFVYDLVGVDGVAPFDVPDLDKAITEAVATLQETNSVVLDPDIGVYTPETWLYERESARMLSQFLTPAELVIDLDIFLTNYERVNDITLSDLQRDAVYKLVANRVLVVTGAPGTGKTTLIRTFVQLFKNLGISFSLMAPTGIAAKRLSSVTEVGAQTIHRALRYDGFIWGRDASSKFETQAVVLDEVSMVDQELLYRLLDALNPATMLVIVGDDAQLPSVGAGNVLRELLACSAIPHVRLEHIFRQAETSDIVLAAHRIRRGQSPFFAQPKANTEFQFVSVLHEGTIADLIVKMALKLKSRDANFQVLSPKYDGEVGVDNLNKLLRDSLNPDRGQPNWESPSLDVRVGDRLMVIKNNYKLNVYNGDIGKLISIKQGSLSLRIHGVGKTPDTQVDIPKDLAPMMLKLAYAVTVHRCQGEEFETVILPLVRSQGRMLQRNLFYTAVTRARKKVWLLGDSDAVLKAVANDKVVQRNTQLRNLIRPADAKL